MPHPKPITSAANPVVKALKALALKKYRDEDGLFVVEGARHLMEAIEAGWHLHSLALTEDAIESVPDLLSAAAESYVMPAELLSRITGRDNTQNVIGALKQRVAVLSEVGTDKNTSWIVLEDIRDPGNLGTIMRTADAVQTAGIILVGQTCDAFSPEAIRATMGSFARLQLVRTSLADFAAWKKTWAGRMTGTHLRTDTDYRAGDYTGPHLLAMGSEQNGLSETLTGLCDQLVKIPMPGGTESLNLGVSTGIMLYEMGRNRL